MRILLFGANGQVGWQLRRALLPVGEVIALDRASTSPIWGDLEQPSAIAAGIEAVAPDWVVNAAAYTAVDKAESDVVRATTVNATAVGAMAAACARVGAGLLHYSTDYVFAGSGTEPWGVDAPVAPLSAYGATKAAGELAIRASGCRHMIVRTSWVYAARGQNFARTMLRLAAERDNLSVVGDQVGAPTGAELLADMTAHALQVLSADGLGTARGGTYHVAARGETSWFDYAEHVIAYARARGMSLTLSPTGLRRIATAEYPTPARRPLNSRLDVSRFERDFGVTLPHWTMGVNRVLDEWLARG
jgi:dTDP-4-dehydrorhamnose reductase